jgi:hypothetical protein
MHNITWNVEDRSLLAAIKAASSNALTNKTEQSLKVEVLDVLIVRLQIRYGSSTCIELLYVGSSFCFLFLLKGLKYSRYRS